MLCEKCGQREATVHITEIVDGRMTKRELCDVCGKDVVMIFSSERDRQGFAAIIARDRRYTQAAYRFVTGTDG